MTEIAALRDVLAEYDAPDWEPPIPLDGITLPPFPVDSLPSWAEAFVCSVAELTQTEFDLPGGLALAVISAAVTGKYCVQVMPGYHEPVHLWLNVVAAPAERKSAVLQHVCAPLYAHELAEQEKRVRDVAEAGTHRAILERRLKDATQKASAAKESTEREKWERAARGFQQDLADCDVPAPYQLVAADATPEAIANLLAAQGGRLAILSAEGELFSIAGGRYAKNGHPNFEVLLKAHAGDPVRVNRVGRAVPLMIDRATLTIGLCVQPAVITGLARTPAFRDKGLVGRFLFLWPSSNVGHRTLGKALPDTVRKAWDDGITTLCRLNGEATLNLHPDALDAWRLFYEGWCEPELRPDGLMATFPDWGGKLHGAAIRLAGLLHVAEYPLSSPIAMSTVNSAVQLAKYFAQHAAFTYAAMGADPDMSGAREVLEWILRKGATTFTHRDAFDQLRPRFQQSVELNGPLRVLTDHCFIRRREQDKRQGRPSEVWDVNPSVHE